MNLIQYAPLLSYVIGFSSVGAQPTGQKSLFEKGTNNLDLNLCHNVQMYCDIDTHKDNYILNKQVEHLIHDKYYLVERNKQLSDRLEYCGDSISVFRPSSSSNHHIESHDNRKKVEYFYHGRSMSGDVKEGDIKIEKDFADVIMQLSEKLKLDEKSETVGNRKAKNNDYLALRDFCKYTYDYCKPYFLSIWSRGDNK